MTISSLVAACARYTLLYAEKTPVVFRVWYHKRQSNFSHAKSKMKIDSRNPGARKPGMDVGLLSFVSVARGHAHVIFQGILACSTYHKTCRRFSF